MTYFYLNLHLFDVYIRISRWSKHRGPRLDFYRPRPGTIEIWFGCIYMSATASTKPKPVNKIKATDQ